MYLYLIKFMKKPLMKIGLAKDARRIYQLECIYGKVDMDNSVLVSGKDKKVTRMLESQLLYDFLDYRIHDKSLEGKDGYTELRSFEAFESILDEIKYKATKFPGKNIKFHTFDELFLYHQNQKYKKRKNKEELYKERLKNKEETERIEKDTASKFIAFLKTNLSKVDSLYIDGYAQFIIALDHLNSEEFEEALSVWKVSFTKFNSNNLWSGGLNVINSISYTKQDGCIEFHVSLRHYDDSDIEEARLFIDNLFRVFSLEFNKDAYKYESERIYDYSMKHKEERSDPRFWGSYSYCGIGNCEFLKRINEN